MHCIKWRQPPSAQGQVPKTSNRRLRYEPGGSASRPGRYRADAGSVEAFLRGFAHPLHGAAPGPAKIVLEGGKELPPAIFRELEREAKDIAERIKLELESALSDASPFERIPLFELLLAAGQDSLARAPDFPAGLARRFLVYAAGSDQEKMLEAFLAVVAGHERTVTMAYLLSQAGEDKSSVKHLFGVFQTGGIKFDQFSSTWKLFGEEVAQETKSLKDSARPMTKAELLAAAEKELTPEEFARIRRLNRVLGSASLKTVAVIELVDGREIVMLVQRPRATEQIDTNLDLAGEFLRELARRGARVVAGMFDSIVRAVRKQLGEETRMTLEADKVGQAKARYLVGEPFAIDCPGVPHLRPLIIGQVGLKRRSRASWPRGRACARASTTTCSA